MLSGVIEWLIGMVGVCALTGAIWHFARSESKDWGGAFGDAAHGFLRGLAALPAGIFTAACVGGIVTIGCVTDLLTIQPPISEISSSANIKTARFGFPGFSFHIDCSEPTQQPNIALSPAASAVSNPVVAGENGVALPKCCTSAHAINEPGAADY